MQRIILISLFALLTAAGCTRVATTSLPSVPVDERFEAKVLRWESGARMIFAYKVFDNQGMTAVCGAWSVSPGGGPGSDRIYEWALSTMRMEVQGETLLGSIDFFTRGTYVEDERPSAQARCRRTSVPWSSQMIGRAELRTSRTRFKVYD